MTVPLQFQTPDGFFFLPGAYPVRAGQSIVPSTPPFFKGVRRATYFGAGYIAPSSPSNRGLFVPGSEGPTRIDYPTGEDLFIAPYEDGVLMVHEGSPPGPGCYVLPYGIFDAAGRCLQGGFDTPGIVALGDSVARRVERAAGFIVTSQNASASADVLAASTSGPPAWFWSPTDPGGGVGWWLTTILLHDLPVKTAANLNMQDSGGQTFIHPFISSSVNGAPTVDYGVSFMGYGDNSTFSLTLAAPNLAVWVGNISFSIFPVRPFPPSFASRS